MLVVINVSATAGQVLMSDWIIERAERSHAVEANQSVTIVNLYGDIRTRGSGEKEVALYAVTQRHKDDTEIPEIIFESDKDRLTVKIAYSNQSGTALPERFAKRRTDIAVFVPSTLELTLNTLDGRAESKGHKGRLVIHPRDGRIIAATTGSVEAHSNSGKVKVEFRNRIWSGPSMLQSVSGDIRVFLMSDPHVKVDIDTAGNITTDYSMDIRAVPGGSRKIARAAIGEGEHELNITSAIGAVRLGRIFDMVPASPANPQTEQVDIPRPQVD